jgi:phosphoglycerol transferase MdoB-like AlkP superfamily enzyme
MTSQFERTKEIVQFKEPKFVLYHITVTHEPFVFDQNGGFQTIESERLKGSSRSFIDSIIYTNTYLKELIDLILAKSNRPSVIILQGDEGPYPPTVNSILFPWRKASDSELKMKFSILSAYYFPNIKTNVLYSSISPVNTFRVVFNLYFGAGLKLLSDRVYASCNFRHPYDFFEVSDRVR